MKPPTYFFLMKTMILADFQICISVPLNSKFLTSQPGKKTIAINILTQYLRKQRYSGNEIWSSNAI